MTGDFLNKLFILVAVMLVLGLFTECSILNEQRLNERTVCATENLVVNCQNYEKIIIESYKAGAKKQSSCRGINPKFRRSCCTKNTTTDCLNDINDIAAYRTCTGQSSCQIFQSQSSVTCKNNAYPIDYKTLQYYCIEDYRTGQCISSVFKSCQRGQMLYLTSPGYPNNVTGSVNCACSISSDCYDSIEIMEVDVQIPNNGKLNFDDTHYPPLEALKNNQYKISYKDMFTSFGNKIILNASLDNGKFLIAIRTTPNCILTITCPTGAYTRATNCDRPSSTISIQSSTISEQSSTISVQSSTISVQSSTISVQSSTISVQSSTISIPNSTISIPNSTISIPNSTISLQSSTISVQSSTISIPNSTISLRSSTNDTTTGTQSYLVANGTSYHNRPSSKERPLREITVCASEELILICQKNEKIIIESYKAGSKQTNACSGNKCCIKDNNKDCQSVIHVNALYRRCTGRSSCHLPSTLANITCGNILYESDYHSVQYYCIDDYRVGHCTSSVMKSCQKGEILYLTSPGYPSNVLGTMNCSCSISSDCFEDIDIFGVDVQISENGLMKFDDNTTIYTGFKDNQFIISTQNMYTSFKNDILLTAKLESGRFLIAIRPKSGCILNIKCPVNVPINASNCNRPVTTEESTTTSETSMSSHMASHSFTFSSLGGSSSILNNFTSASFTEQSKKNADNTLSAETIIGIAVGVLFLVAFGSLIAFIIGCKRKQMQKFFSKAKRVHPSTKEAMVPKLETGEAMVHKVETGEVMVPKLETGEVRTKDGNIVEKINETYQSSYQDDEKRGFPLASTSKSDNTSIPTLPPVHPQQCQSNKNDDASKKEKKKKKHKKKRKYQDNDDDDDDQRDPNDEGGSTKAKKKKKKKKKKDKHRRHKNDMKTSDGTEDALNCSNDIPNGSVENDHDNAGNRIQSIEVNENVTTGTDVRLDSNQTVEEFHQEVNRTETISDGNNHESYVQSSPALEKRKKKKRKHKREKGYTELDINNGE